MYVIVSFIEENGGQVPQELIESKDTQPSMLSVLYNIL